jgi:ribonuclease P/MRP protein subunit RPP1
MKRTFTDLHLRVNGRDPAANALMLNKAVALDYRLVAVPCQSETHMDEIVQMQNACKEAGMDFASRVNLRPRSQNELLSQLRRLRRKFEVVCVLCENKEVARQAAKDRRVDLLNFPQLDYRKRFFDRAEAELASNSLATLEIDIKPLLVLEGPARVRLLSCLRRETAVARDFHMHIVVSSGVSDTMLLRKPREMAALASLFGLDGDLALDAVSQNPMVIVKRNREKLGSRFVAPGIRVVKEGKDC